MHANCSQDNGKLSKDHRKQDDYKHHASTPRKSGRGWTRESQLGASNGGGEGRPEVGTKADAHA